MPSRSLQCFSPFELIFNKSPNYDKLSIFGCLCYPWLHPYSAHKLDVRSKPCIFLGYSLSQSAYICFNLQSSKFFSSRHVRFDESIFPYPTLLPSHSKSNSSSPPPWIPHILSIVAPVTVPPPFTPPTLPPSAAHPVSSSITTTNINRPTVPPTQPSPVMPTLPSPLNTHPAPPIAPSHPMTTRSKNNIHKPIRKLTFHTNLSSTDIQEPTSVTNALKEPK